MPKGSSDYCARQYSISWHIYQRKSRRVPSERFIIYHYEVMLVSAGSLSSCFVLTEQGGSTDK